MDPILKAAGKTGGKGPDAVNGLMKTQSAMIIKENGTAGVSPGSTVFLEVAYEYLKSCACWSTISFTFMRRTFVEFSFSASFMEI